MKKIITPKENYYKAVATATYADEVCSWDYYYKEDENYGYLYAGCEEESDYRGLRFPRFDKMKETHGMELACFFIEREIKSNGELVKLQQMTVQDLLAHGKFLTTYCDFLFCNASLCDAEGPFVSSEVEVDDEPKFTTIGAEHTDINAFSSMINHLKEELIRKIKGVAGCLEFERFAFNPRYGDNSTFCTYCIDGDFFFCKDDDVFWFENEDGDSLGDLDDCVVEELLHLYSKLHK